VIALKTLADGRKLLGRIPKERRDLLHYELRRFVIIFGTAILWLSATVVIFIGLALLHTP
jgi:hypothetical protein